MSFPLLYIASAVVLLLWFIVGGYANPGS
ncbi:MAG: YoaK family small membrane protein [Serratia liquefaciens]|nr:YoaK family small membrane protein [Serratia liquefaciens]